MNLTLPEKYLALCRLEIEMRQFGGVEAIFYLDRLVGLESVAQKKEALNKIITNYGKGQ